MRNNKKCFIALLILACLCVSMALSGCESSVEPSDDSVSGDYQYAVKVVTEGGMPLANVQVKVFNRGDSLVFAGYTDKEGSLTFASPQYGLNAVLSELPKGYRCDAAQPLNEKENKIVVKTFFVGTDIVGNKYTLGSIVDDFSVTAVNGKTYKVSELLETKKAVVLNFWFENCGPCRMEFPYLNEAYNEYKDKLEVIAISPVDSENAVSAYAKDMKLDFPMVSANLEWEQAFGFGGYPTTVVIDRYGMVAMMHTGAVTDKEAFASMFEHFTSDEYKQGVVKNLSELK